MDRCWHFVMWSILQTILFFQEITINKNSYFSLMLPQSGCLIIIGFLNIRIVFLDNKFRATESRSIILCTKIIS